MRRKVDSIHVRSFKSEVTKLIKKHGKVVIYFGGGDELRRRIIDEDGDSEVSYRLYGNHRWSRYDESCFMSYYKTGGYHDWNDRWIPERVARKAKKKTLKNTLNALIKHDKENDICPIEVRYGKGLKKVLFIRGNY